MRNNLSGLAGYALGLLGIACYALWLVSLADGMSGMMMLAGALTAILVILGTGLLVATLRQDLRSTKVAAPHRDPLEPETSAEDSRKYELIYHHRLGPLPRVEAERREWPRNARRPLVGADQRKLVGAGTHTSN